MPYVYEHPHPAVAVDVAIFTNRGRTLTLLLVRRAQPPFEGDWALPGGFVGIDESLKHAAWRELKEETGVNAAHLEQLHAFGHPQRDPRERVISVVYYAIVVADKIAVRAASDAAEAAWYDVDALPPLAFDHTRIIDRARRRLAERLATAPIALRLMPETFTFPELTRAFEAIGGQPLDKRNFRKRVLAQRWIEPTGEKRRGGARRPAELYRTAPHLRLP